MSITNINALDRVPTEVLENGAIRYEEFDENGVSLGYKYMKRADAPSEAGTNINKALFDLIDNNTNEEIGERSRVDRYNVPTLNVSNSTNILSLDLDINAYFDNQKISIKLPDDVENFTSNIIPYLTSNSQDGFETVGLAFSTSYDAYKACASSGYFMSDNQTYEKGIDWQIKLPFLVKPTVIQFNANHLISSASLQASINGTTWETIAENIGVNSGTKTLTLTLNKYYRYFKIVSPGYINSSDVRWYLQYFEIVSGSKSMFNEYFTNYINVNDLGQKQINGTMKVENEYELIYNGESFDAKEPFTKVSSNMSIKTGTISHGATIPQTSGYTNYLYMVSINLGECEGVSQPNSIRLVKMGVKASVDQTTRTVTAQVGLGTSSTSSGGVISYTSATANYTELAWN